MYNFPSGTVYKGPMWDGMFHGEGELHMRDGGKIAAVWRRGRCEKVRVYLSGNSVCKT